jgi:hypothetical protein
MTARDIVVIGLGEEDWTDPEVREWVRYGEVRVRIGSVEYSVGVAIGVPEYLRATAEAAGGDRITPYLWAWYVDADDWAAAPAYDAETGQFIQGQGGVPEKYRDDVLDAIRSAARRLWREYESA